MFLIQLFTPNHRLMAAYAFLPVGLFPDLSIA